MSIFERAWLLLQSGRFSFSNPQFSKFAVLIAASFLLHSAPPSRASDLKYYDRGVPVNADELIDQIPPNVRNQWKGWVNRLQLMIARRQVTAPWFVESIVVRAGEAPPLNFPLPVLRVVFREQSFFDFDKSDVKPEALPIINLVAQLIRTDGGPPFTLVVGHTDSLGTNEYNDRLSELRAANAVKQLTAIGVPVKRLHTAGMGSRIGIAKNNTAEGRAVNRRVEFLISLSFDANLKALVQIPGEPDDGPVSQGAPAKPPSEAVEIHDGEGKSAGHIIVRPPRQIKLRDF
jgi:outer membrane protein OmpA-like peptidoglycan-associated protein